MSPSLLLCERLDRLDIMSVKNLFEPWVLLTSRALHSFYRIRRPHRCIPRTSFRARTHIPASPT